MAIFTPAGGQAAALSSIKAGAYPCEIVGAVEKVSKDGQFSQHSLRARVFDEANDDWEDFWELLTFSPKAQWKLEEVMQALGIGFSVGVAVQVEAGDWLGKTGRLVLKRRWNRARNGCGSAGGCLAKALRWRRRGWPSMGPRGALIPTAFPSNCA